MLSPETRVGGGVEVDGSYAVTRAFAVSTTVAGGRANFGDGAGAMVAARWLFDGERIRVAPFFAGGVGQAAEGGPVAAVAAGVSLEVPFYTVLVDVSVPVLGWSAWNTPTLPFSLGDPRLLPAFLLVEAGFTWRLSPQTTFRLGYLALATSWSWRWANERWTVEVSGHTNVVTGSLSVRGGVRF